MQPPDHPVLEGCCGALGGVEVCCGVMDAVVERAAGACCGVVDAGAGGVKTGVVTVHLLQVVMVSVVTNVDVVVTTSVTVLPPRWWVVVTGQLVTVV